MAGEIEGAPLGGEARSRRAKWITFEQDEKGRLFVRTLHGFKIIEDPEQADRILRMLEEVADVHDWHKKD